MIVVVVTEIHAVTESVNYTQGHPEQNGTKNLDECMKCSCCEIHRPVGPAQQVLQLRIKVVSHHSWMVFTKCQIWDMPQYDAKMIRTN